MSAIDDLRESLQALKKSGEKINLNRVAQHAGVTPSYLNKDETEAVRDEILKAAQEWKQNQTLQDLKNQLEKTEKKLKAANSKIKKLQEQTPKEQKGIVELLVKKLNELYSENDKLKQDLRTEREENSNELSEEIRFDEETGEIISGIKFK